MLNLSISYKNQGLVSRSRDIALCKECYEIQNLILGVENHPEIFSDMNNLATIYSNHDKYKDAEILYKQCLENRKSIILGNKNHPNTLATIK